MTLTQVDIDNIVQAQSPVPNFGYLTHDEIDRLMEAFGKALNAKAKNRAKVTCPTCDGHKQKWNSIVKMMEDCSLCKGAGVI